MLKISVVVPVYNVEKYLKQCLDSIIGQTYRNLEIICVNDGSTDGCAEILEYYAKMDDRVRVIHKENQGYGHSVNLGLREATGEYIGIIESDDYISQDMYEILANAIESVEEILDVVKASYFHVSKTNIEEQVIFDNGYVNRAIRVEEYPDLFCVPCSVWSAVYRKDFLINNQIDFLETPGASYQDTAFAFKVWASAEWVKLLPEPLVYYRVDNEKSSVNSNQKIFCIKTEVEEINRFVAKRNLDKKWINTMKDVISYRAYMWNYFRLHPGLRSAFWSDMLILFQKILDEQTDVEGYWRKEDWKQLLDILQNPEVFFWATNPELKQLEFERYTYKNEIYKKSLPTFLETQKHIIIYGAGAYGKRVLQYMQHMGWRGKIVSFAVTECTDNQKDIAGITIESIEKLLHWKEDVLVFVAVSEEKQLEILRLLDSFGFKKVIRVDEAFWNIYGEKNINNEC